MITAGEVLKKKRESLGKSLITASQDTKIQKRFLQYIENDEFSKFDSEVFLTGFIKIYSKYLTLDTEKILALYRRSHPLKKDISSIKSKTFGIHKRITFTPKSIITLVSIIFFVSILGYIGLQIYKFQSPPTVTIISPEDSIVVTEPTLTVQGITQQSVIIEVNNSLTEVATNGSFQKEITLQEGINIITIRASKNSNSVQETIEIRKVTYTKPETTAQPVEEEPNIFTLKLVVNSSAAWIKLDIDDKNKLAQIVQPSTQEFEVKDSFYIITGKASNTTLYMNDSPLVWKTNSTTGVAEIACTIVDQTLECE